MSRVSTPDGDVAFVELRPLTWSSALRRAAVGIVILTSMVGLVAWLTYTNIEQQTAEDQVSSVETGSGQTPASEF